MIAAILNNRELAGLLWISLGVLVMCFSRDLRESLVGIAKVAAQPAIVLSTLSFAAYCGVLLVGLGSKVGLWEAGLVKATVIWFIGVGLGLLMTVGGVVSQHDWFRREVRKVLRITVVIEFFVGLAVLGLVLELLLLPIVTGLVLVSALGESREDLRSAKAVSDGLLGFTGVGLMAFVGFHVITEWQQFATQENLLLLALPAWLSFAALPFIYALGLFSSYQSALGFVSDAAPDRGARLRGRVALACTLGVSARDAGRFRVFEATKVAEAPSLRHARAAVREFRARLAQEREIAESQERRLRDYAGVQGSDAEGLQLDQREFTETKEALQYLATAQTGWYANREHVYRGDLLALLEPFAGLPDDHRISMEVAADGQSWWAWRRTITGWCFAIGSASPPPDEWLYDGPDPPNGYPGKDPAWEERWGLDARNWMGSPQPAVSESGDLENAA